MKLIPIKYEWMLVLGARDFSSILNKIFQELGLSELGAVSYVCSGETQYLQYFQAISPDFRMNPQIDLMAEMRTSYGELVTSW